VNDELSAPVGLSGLDRKTSDPATAEEPALEITAVLLTGELTAECFGHRAQRLQILFLEGIAARQIELASKRL
jgi:hypothetical protein